MELRSLGRNGLRCSALGLGTVKLGRNQGVKYPQPFDLPDDAQVRDLLAVARELGITLIDTAPAYGLAEERLGRLLPGPREDWVLATKVGESFDAGHSSFDFSPSAVRASIQRSLDRLRTDYLDVVLIHSDGNDKAILENSGAVETLLAARDAGLVRAVGLSGKTVDGGLGAVAELDVVMVTLNPLNRDEVPVVRAAAVAGRGVLVKKALVSGHLQPLGADPVATCLRAVFSEPGVTSVVIGTCSPAHLRANAASLDRVLAE